MFTHFSRSARSVLSMKRAALTGRLRLASPWNRWPACRSPSRTIFRYGLCPRHVLQEYSKDTFLLIQPRPSSGCGQPAQSLLEKRTAMNLRWALQQRTRDITSLATRTTSIAFLAVLAADRQPVWLPEHHSLHSARIPEDRYGHRQPFAEWSV